MPAFYILDSIKEVQHGEVSFDARRAWGTVCALSEADSGDICRHTTLDLNSDTILGTREDGVGNSVANFSSLHGSISIYSRLSIHRLNETLQTA
jgi:hypothetical protein